MVCRPVVVLDAFLKVLVGEAAASPRGIWLTERAIASRAPNP